MKNLMLPIPFSIGLAVLLSSCSGAVSKPAPAEKTPTELLTGSWYAMETEIDSEGNSETNKIVLTLTPERYIYHMVEYESDGDIESFHYWSGEWRANETVISTTTQWRIVDEERYSDPVPYEKKNYYLSDNDDVLYVHRWINQEARHYERFVRHAGLGDISGTYVYRHDRTIGSYDWRVEWTYEITNDSFVETRYSERNGELWEQWRLAGDLAFDRTNYHMLVLVTDVNQSFEGETSMHLDREQFVGHTLRFAYAPTAESDRIAISRMSNELSYDADSKTWSDREDYPYGNYWIFAKRQ